MAIKINVITHSAIKVISDKIIYVDPFNLPEKCLDADVIFITHGHYDHFSLEDIEKVRKNDTILVYPKSIENDIKAAGYVSKENIAVQPWEKAIAAGIVFESVPAYNVGKPFHPKENNWVGYVLNIEGQRIYVCGDTDDNSDIESVKCDIALVPVGGKYTMNAQEAASFVNIIKPRIAIPTHYGTVTGSAQDGQNFKKLVEKDIKVNLEGINYEQ